MRSDDFFDHEHVTVIEPPRAWHKLDLAELWAYRELLWVLIAKDVRVRYKQTIIGAAWALLRPLTMMGLFTLIFGYFAKMPSDGQPYAVFAYTGLVPWMFFSTAVLSASGSLVGSAHLVSKVYFPRLIIPLASVGAGLVDLLVASAMVLPLVSIMGQGVRWQWALAPLVLIAVVVLALGVGTLLCALTVSYRDFTHLTPFALQVGMYATPVVYPLSAVPDQWKWVFYANPMTGFVEALRWCFLGTPLDGLALGVSALVALLMLAWGVLYFDRVERRFADVI